MANDRHEALAELDKLEAAVDALTTAVGQYRPVGAFPGDPYFVVLEEFAAAGWSMQMIYAVNERQWTVQFSYGADVGQAQGSPARFYAAFEGAAKNAIARRRKSLLELED